MRRVLARYLGVGAAAIEFTYGVQGKPRIADHLRSSQLEFNLSHCERLALVAVTSQLSVGADVETVRPLPDFLDIAKRYFTKQEYAKLTALPETEAYKAFFRCWTRKEAVIKALGCGLTMPLHSFEVTLSADKPARLVSGEPALIPFRDWSLIHLEPLDDVVGTVAVPLKKVAAAGFLLADW